MPLKFIFGPSGSGKSYRLYQEVIEKSIAHPEQNFIVLVPEQFTMQTQKDLVMQHPRHGIMNIDVLSFGRLAYRVFEETGGGKLPVLDDEGKNLILRKIAADHEKELKVLRGNMKKLGYISEVKSVISEFTQYDIGGEELLQVMESVDTTCGLYYKLQDIRILYQGFLNYLDQKYITKEEILDLLCKEIPKSELLENSTIVLDGFTGFTPVQNRLLRELMLRCREVIVTVIMDRRENPFVYRHPYQLFALSKHMVTSLIETAGEVKVPVEEAEELYEETPYRFRGNPVLAHLEQNIFRYAPKIYEEEQEVIRLHRAANPRQEAFRAVGEIRKLIRERGWRYRDIGIIVSDMNTYGDYLEEAFEDYEIPAFMDHKRSILLNPFVEYLRSLLHMVEQNFSYESVFRYLRTGLSGLSYEDTCRLENYVRGLGIRGYKKWQERWIRRLKGIDEEALEQLNHCREAFVEKIDALVFVLKQRRKTVKDITMALYEFMVQEEVQLRLKKQEEMFAENKELALAKEYAQIYRILMDLFDKFVTLLGDETLSLSEYEKLLDAGLSEARVGVIPPGPDQVVVGDVKRTRLKDIKALFFLGANDAFLPGNLLKTGLLSERDREMFRREKLALAPGGKEEAYVQKFYLYMNLTKPSEELHIYYSQVSSTGKSMRPAYLIQDIRRIFPKSTILEEEARNVDQIELTEEMGMQMLIRGFHERGLADAGWKELYSWYRRQPHWRERVEQFLRAGYYRRPMDGLTMQIAKKLYGEDFENSISRMERFSACAFAHFLTYGLELKERQEYEFQAVDLGNVCHSALERFSGKLSRAGIEWTEVTEEQRRSYIDESVDEAVTDYGNSVLYSTARNEYMIERIKQVLERTVWALTRQLEEGHFVPEACEFRFKNGKIDRIDVCEDRDKVYVKVMDYKTGSKAFDVALLYHGLQLQLMVYMNAAVEYEQRKHPDKEVIPSGVFYYRIQDPYIDKEKNDDVESALLRELRLDGMINLKDDSLGNLIGNVVGDPLAVPAKLNKDGSISKTSKVLKDEYFQLMMRHAARKVRKTHEKILSGETGAEPYRRGQMSGCDYCRYRHICGFDLKVPGFAYRDITGMNLEKALKAMEKDEVEDR